MSEIEIKKLVFPENIRQKVGMYLGDSTTPTTAIREIIDNSIDEAINKFANNIRVVIDNKTYWSSSADDGRGIPIYLDEHHDDDREITLDLFTMTHVGGKFEAEEASLGTHGVGTKGTNATSNHFIVLVNIDRNKNTKTRPKWVNEKYVKGSKSIYILHFQKGLFTYKDVLSYSEVLTYLESIDNNTLGIVPPTMDDWSSLVLVRPDETIFSSLVTKYSDRELRLAKLLYPEINIGYNGTTIEPFSIQSDSFRNTKFIEDKVFTIELDYENKYDYHGNPRTSKNKFVMAFGYSSDDYSHLTDGSVNTLDTPDGFHVNLVNRLVQRAFKDRFNDMDLKDATYGLRVFTLLLTNSAEYTSQDKTKLGRVYGVDFDSVLPLFKTQFNKIVSENSDYFESLILRINEYKMTIGTLSQKNYVKSVVIMGDDRRSKSLGAQMFDCSTKDRSKAELYIVEGKSACFVKGTLVRTLNGDKPIEEVTADDYVICCTTDGEPIVSKVSRGGFVSKQVDTIVEVLLDNGEKIKCTPDHLFMLRNGAYIESRDLTPGTSLMPYYEYVCDEPGDSPRPVLHRNDGLGEIMIHRLVGEQKFAGILSEYRARYKESKDRRLIPVIHHKDKNPFNNSPDNLEVLTSSEHFRHHNLERNCKDWMRERTRTRMKLPENKYITDALHAGRDLYFSDPSNKERISEIARLGYLSAEHKLREWSSSPENSEFMTNRNIKTYEESHSKIQNILLTLGIDLESTEVMSLDRLEDIRLKYSEVRESLIKSGEISSSFSRVFCYSMVPNYFVTIDNEEYFTTSFYNRIKKRILSIPDIKYGENSYSVTYLLRVAKLIEYSLTPVVLKYIVKVLTTTRNHKVMSVRTIHLNEKIPVYDITVKSECHNFPLSAGVYVHNCGGLVQSRDPKIHAILPLRGKIFNSSNSELEDALKNKELLTMINCIGVGVSPYVDLSKARYGRIVISSDSDVDGSHIQLLVLGAFAKFLPEVIESGMLYLGLAPLYEQKVDGKPKYFWSDNEHELNKSKAFSRYKGLGSTNPRQLRDTLLNPDSRRLIQITPEGIDKAIQLLQDSYLRRELMVENGVLDLNTIQDISDDQIEEIIEYSVDQLTDDEINLIEEGL